MLAVDTNVLVRLITNDDPKRLEGTFTSTAANTSGTTRVEIAPQ